MRRESGVHGLERILAMCKYPTESILLCCGSEHPFVHCNVDTTFLFANLQSLDKQPSSGTEVDGKFSI